MGSSLEQLSSIMALDSGPCVFRGPGLEPRRAGDGGEVDWLLMVRMQLSPDGKQNSTQGD
jgi:hypothetical protein